MKIVPALCYLIYGLMAASLLLLDWPSLSPLTALLVCLAGIFIADLLSGILHVYLDYLPFPKDAGIERAYFYVGPRDSAEYLESKAVIFKPLSAVHLLSFNFKIHHWKPKAINRKDYAWHALDTMPPAYLVVIASFFLPPTAALCAVVVSFFVLNTQFIHSCIHDTHKSVFWKRVVRQLQKLHIIYSFETHMTHHRDGRENFCLITGWANFLLNPVCALLFRRQVLNHALWESLRHPNQPPPMG